MHFVRKLLCFIKFILTQNISLFFYRKYFVNFIEEYWPKAKKGVVIARVEVYKNITGSTVKEMQIYTRKLDEYYRLREKYDFKDITKKEMYQLEKEINVLNSVSDLVNGGSQ